MIAVALKGLLGRKLRATLTAFAIVLGVAMVSGSLVLTDTLGRSFDRIFDDSYKSSDVVVSSKDAISSDGNRADAPGFPADVLRKVQSLPGVDATEGSIEDAANLVDKNGKPIGSADDGVALTVDPATDQSLNPLKLVRGTWPQGAGQIAIDSSTANEKHFDVGDSIGAFADGPVRSYRVTGIVQYGSVSSLGGATIAVFDLPTAQRLFDKREKLDLIRIAASPGVSAADLTRRIRPLLPETAQVRPASAQASSDSKEVQDGLSYFRDFLLAFGGIALFAGSFVIANTLSITVAQRVRELATLRTLGASRRQVLRSVVLEALVIGLVASFAGLFLGLALAKGLDALLKATGIDLPQTGLVFATRTIVVSLVVGTVITVLASLRPALRATRVEPIAAVREGAELPKSRLARFGLVTSASVVVAAVALLSYGVFAGGLATATRLLSLAGGVLLLFVGVALVAPRVVRPLTAVLGWPGTRVGGVAGKLARENAMRNPSRTASTAAALMIGLALITFVAVLGQGVRTSFAASVNELFVADYALTAEGNPLTDLAVRAAEQAPGVEVVSAIRTGNGTLLGKTVSVNGVDRNLTQVIDMRWHRGSSSVPAQLGRDGAFVKKEYAEDHGLDIGSALRLKTPTGTTLALRLEGIFAEPKGGSPFADVAISTANFDRSFASRDNEFTFLDMRGGATPANTAALERALRAFPAAEVQTREEFKDGVLGDMTMILNVLYALLALSVIVSLFGIVNTLVLSVFERTRELGMLRAIGMTRRQVRRMIRHESIVTALIGATLGIAVGMFLAGLVTRALSDEGIVFAVPYGSLGVFVLAAIAAGMLAAILPARRASRLNVLEALQYE